MNSTPLNCCNCLLSGWWQASRILCPAHRLAGELWWAPRRFDVFHVTMWYAENQVQAKSENHEEAVKLAGSSAGYCMAFWKNTTPCPSIFRSKNPWSWRESWVILENRLVNNGDCWPFSGVMHIFSIFFATCDLYNFGKFRDESCWSSMEPWEVVGEKLKAITVCQIILDAFFFDSTEIPWKSWSVVSPTSILSMDFVFFVHGASPILLLNVVARQNVLLNSVGCTYWHGSTGFPERKWGQTHEVFQDLSLSSTFTWELLNGLGICWFPCIGRASAVLWHVMLYLRYKEAIEPESKQWLSHRKGRNQQFNFQLIETIIIWTIEILTAPLRSPCFCMPRFAEEAQVVFQKSQDKCGEAHFI